MKFLYTLIMIIVVHIGVYTEQSSAHVLLADQSIGAIVHIEPNDNPVTGKQSQLTFYFEDITNRFSLSQCDCSIRLLKANGAGMQEISNEKLYAISQLESSNTYVFNEPGDYTVEINGKPQTGDDTFQEFSFSYNFRVIADGIESQAVTPLLLLGLAGMIGLVMLGALQNVED